MRIGNGDHFNASSPKHTWGITSTHSAAKGFLKSAKEGDLLWFVTNSSNGKIVAVATFMRTEKRINGPLIQLTPTNEQLGWTKTSGDWDTYVYYKDLYNLTDCNLHSEIKGNTTIRNYNDNCKVNLPIEYANIVRYSKISDRM